MVEITDQNMVGGALDNAIELLQGARKSFRLKIGRPHLTSSVFAVQGGEEVSNKVFIAWCYIKMLTAYSSVVKVVAIKNANVCFMVLYKDG